MCRLLNFQVNAPPQMVLELWYINSHRRKSLVEFWNYVENFVCMYGYEFS